MVRIPPSPPSSPSLGRWRLRRACDGHWTSAIGSATKTESHPLRHSTRLPARLRASRKGSLMASQCQGECPERSSEASKSKGNNSNPSTLGRWHRRPMWFVYMLRCADDSLYIGETNEVERRLARHNDGAAAAHTAKRLPVRLVYTEQHPTRDDCLKRERQSKRWTRAKKEALIAGDKLVLRKL